MDKTWLLIDSNNWTFRDLSAAGLDRVADLFRQRVWAICHKWSVSHVIAAYDAGVTFRHQMHPGYKAGRTRNPDIDEAIEMTKQSCYDDSIDVITAEGFEADDVIATYTRHALSLGDRVIVASADKDLHQLIEESKVCQLTSIRRWQDSVMPKWANHKSVFDKYGVTVDQWVDYRMLVGDPSDNIAGVKDIGPKTAQKIISTCGSIEGFLANPHAPDITAKQQAKVLNAREDFDHLRELITLRYDVPVDLGAGVA